MYEIDQLIDEGEGGNVEFKRSLEKEIHLNEEKLNSLAGQMRNRIICGDGKAVYVIGVNDYGCVKGLDDEDFSETLSVLSVISEELGASISNVEYEDFKDGKVGIVEIVEKSGNDLLDDSNQILVATAGHVDHGKSTLVSSMVSGDSDNGEGLLRKRLDVLPHEIERGLSADISYSVYGFKDGEVVNLDRKNDKKDVVRKSDRIVSFVDTVGHKSWISTAIRGIVGQNLDYGILTIAADEGITDTTKEHLGVLMAVDLPVLVVITKVDLVDDDDLDNLEKDIENLLKNTGCRSMSVNRHGVERTLSSVISSVKSDDINISPIIRSSAVNRKGIDELNRFMKNLPKYDEVKEESFRMYVDDTYDVPGVGKVVSGTIRSGKVEKDDTLFLGPNENGDFVEVNAKSLEKHYYSIKKARQGEMISIAISGLEDMNLKRGMILTDKENPNSVKRFKSEIMILNHPTSITDGYEPVVHIESITESTVVSSNNPLRAGDVGEVEFEFKYGYYNIREGQKFIFREGKTKGVGEVKEILD